MSPNSPCIFVHIFNILAEDKICNQTVAVTVLKRALFNNASLASV